MPSTPEFEYTYRWADGLDADALEARDQALEAHLANFGGSCSVDFEYPYRWGQILTNPDPKVQIELLTANMEALEQAVTASGGCTLEFPFRWTQFWEALVAGESWAVGIAEENDRAIEFRFGRCTCGSLGLATWTCGNFIEVPASGDYESDVSLGFGDFIFDGDTVPVSPRPQFGYNYPGGSPVTAGTLSLYNKVGAVETLVTSFDLSLASSSSAPDLGDFLAGSEMIMRITGLVLGAPVNIIATFDYYSLFPSFAGAEWSPA